MKKVWYWDRYSARWKLMAVPAYLGFMDTAEAARTWAGTEYLTGLPVVVSDTEPSQE